MEEDDLYKNYIVTYACPKTRGMVLDLVPDGSAHTFVNSLCKLIFRRGCPQIMLSDNSSPCINEITQNFVANINVKLDFLRDMEVAHQTR